jgi:hypothetical protein
MSPEGWAIRVFDFAEAKVNAPRLARTLLEAQQTIDNLTKENQRLEAKVEYQYDELARIQGFYKCLRELPEICDYQTAIFLYLHVAINHPRAMEFWEIGAELRRAHGYEKIATKAEETGQGVWHTIRKALKDEK